MKKVNFQIRTMTRQELGLAVEWAATEGWNPGLHEADSFYTADPSGFLIGLLNEEPIAVISAVKYEDRFGFVGFYIVSPEFREKGFGIQIWNEAMNRLKGRNVGLDGVVDQQENYKKSGFKLAYRNIRYEGVNHTVAPIDTSVVELSSIPFEVIETYDRLFFPTTRSAFLKSWIQMHNNQALAVLQEGRLTGYGALKGQTTLGACVYLDIPEPNENALELVKRHNMTVVFETARMYTGTAPELPLDRLYGVTTFELG